MAAKRPERVEDPVANLAEMRRVDAEIWAAVAEREMERRRQQVEQSEVAQGGKRP